MYSARQAFEDAEAQATIDGLRAVLAKTPTRPVPDPDTSGDPTDFQWPLYDESWPEHEETTYEAWMESRSEDVYEVQPYRGADMPSREDLYGSDERQQRTP